MPQGNAGVTHGGATAGSNPMHNLAGERDKDTDLGPIVLKCGEEQFWTVGHHELAKKYKGGDTTIPLIDIVGTAEVFHGSTKGEPQRPPTGAMKEQFGSDNVMDVLEKIIKGGEFQ